jgi:hypothetical protein
MGLLLQVHPPISSWAAAVSSRTTIAADCQLLEYLLAEAYRRQGISDH